MPTGNQIIAHSLAASQFLVRRFVEDLSPPEWLHRPTPQANCAAWLLGHLAVTDRLVLKRLADAGVGDVAQFPALPDGFEHRFSREAGCPQAQEFGDVSMLLPLFDAHRRLLIDVVQAAPADVLDRPSPTVNERFRTLGELVNFMGGHTAMHAGQITIIRRSLGRPPLI